MKEANRAKRGKTSIGRIIHTSIITAFTIAAALIWKDVIDQTILLIVPPQEQLFYKFVAATLATLLVIIVMTLILKAESKAEHMLQRMKTKGKSLGGIFL